MTDALPRFPSITATDYDSFIVALRRVQEHFALSDLELDHYCGFAAGHSGKILGPTRTRGLGPVTLDAFLTALPIDVHFIVNPKKLARFKAGGIQNRRSSHVRANHPRVSKKAVRRVMGELGRKRQAVLHASGLHVTFAGIGGLSRAAALSPEKRKAIAKKAVETRWEKRRIAKAALEKRLATARAAKALGEAA